MTLFYQTRLGLSGLEPGEKIRFYRDQETYVDSMARADGRLYFLTETSAWKVPEISMVRGGDSATWSPLDSMYTVSAGYSPVKFSLVLFTDSSHGYSRRYDYSLLASDTAARRIPCEVDGFFGNIWKFTDTLTVPIKYMRLEVTWDAWANKSLIEFGIPVSSGVDSVILMEQNSFPVIYDAPNPMRRSSSTIWYDRPTLPMSIAIGLGDEKFRILLRSN